MPCTTHERLLTLGQSLSGTITYQAAPGPGVASKIITSYDMLITQPGIVSSPVSFFSLATDRVTAESA